MATSRLVHVAPAVRGLVVLVQVVHARVVRDLMANVAPVEMPVTADRVVKVVMDRVKPKVVQHDRMDIRATRHTFRPTTPIRAGSIRTANARVAIAPLAIGLARDHAPVVREDLNPAVHVDQSPAARAAATAESSSWPNNKGAVGALVVYAGSVHWMQRCGLLVHLEGSE